MSSLMHRLRLVAPTVALVLFGFAVMAQPVVAFHDRDCSDFKTQAQAQRFFKNHNPRKDPHGLDADNDGVACEDLP